MTAIRRIAPLSLALSVLLLAGGASAAPAAKGEGVLKSFGKAVATGVRVGVRIGKAEFRDRRSDAGPGLFKRTMIRTGEAVRATGAAVARMTIKAKEVAASDWKDTKADLKAAKLATSGAIQGAAVRVDNAAVTVNIATAKAVSAAKNKVGAARTGIIGAIKGALAARAARRAEAKALKAANKDMEKFFAEEGNEDLRTVLVGAKKEAHVTGYRAIKALNTAAIAGNVAVSVVSPANLAVAGAVGLMRKGAKDDVRNAERDAYTKAVTDAVNRPGSRVDAARLASWVKAGAIENVPAKPASLDGILGSGKLRRAERRAQAKLLRAAERLDKDGAKQLKAAQGSL